MAVLNGRWLATGLLCALVGVSCGGPSAVPSPTPTAAPSIQLADAVEQLNAYPIRIEEEALDADATLVPVNVPPDPPACPGIGKATTSQFDIVGKNLDVDVVPIENAGVYAVLIGNWLAKNGFEVADQTAAGKRTVTGRSPDGFTVEVSLEEFRDPVPMQLTLTSPCSWPDSVPGGPTKPAPEATTPRTLVEARLTKSACRQPDRYVYNLQAPPYRGPGPHLATLHEQLPSNEVANGLYLPYEWDRGYGSEDPISKRDSQLLVCVTATMGIPNTGSALCKYEFRSKDFGVSEATYDVLVLAARTGKKIASFRMAGTQTDQESCPSTVVYNSLTGLLRGLDAEALEAKLRPIITGVAR